MFTTFIYTYVLATVAQTNFLNHILNRQPGSESATGRKLSFKPTEHQYWPFVLF